MSPIQPTSKNAASLRSGTVAAAVALLGGLNGDLYNVHSWPTHTLVSYALECGQWLLERRASAELPGPPWPGPGGPHADECSTRGSMARAAGAHLECCTLVRQLCTNG
jgi:hypothetical protein